MKIKTLFIISLILVTLVSLSSCSTEPKKFVEDNFSIILDSSFKSVENETTYAFYSSSKYSVICMKEDFSTLENGKDTTIEEYAQSVQENNPDFDAKFKEFDGLYYLEYVNKAERKNFYYNSFVFKGDTAFYMVHFATASKSDNSASNEQFIEWAKSVSIS